MEFLEKNKGWKEPDFDTVLQYLRTILLRRMSPPSSLSSLQYTALTCFQTAHL
jgi:hypothetical protein